MVEIYDLDADETSTPQQPSPSFLTPNGNTPRTRPRVILRRPRSSDTQNPVMQGNITMAPATKAIAEVKATPFKHPSLSKPDPFVTFIVDKEGKVQKFTVHKCVANTYSPFFRAAFEGKFLEGETQTMRLDDVEGGTFGLLVHWLYFQKFEEPDPHTTWGEKIYQLSKVWVLAGRCLIPKLQNQAMTVMMAHIDTAYLTGIVKLVKYAYDGDYPELKKLVVQAIAWRSTTSINFCNPSNVRDFYKLFPTEVWLDVMVAVREHGDKLPAELRGKIDVAQLLVEERLIQHE